MAGSTHSIPSTLGNRNPLHHRPPRRLRGQKGLRHEHDRDYDPYAVGDDCLLPAHDRKETLDAAQSIALVRQRHRRAEEERRCAEARVAATAPAPARPPEAFTPPPKRVERAQIERLTLTFSVTDTRDRLRLLKQYLIDNHYDFQ